MIYYTYLSNGTASGTGVAGWRLVLDKGILVILVAEIKGISELRSVPLS
jgi:hypothetical protein